MLARSRTELAAAAASIRASGGNVITIPTDIADPSQVIAAIDEAEAVLGPISILLPRQQCRDQPGDICLLVDRPATALQRFGSWAEDGRSMSYSALVSGGLRAGLKPALERWR